MAAPIATGLFLETRSVGLGHFSFSSIDKMGRLRKLDRSAQFGHRAHISLRIPESGSSRETMGVALE
ncbi:hypothetical protein PanWU01x14_107440 [Parasponia andersonii]|uniref:Uncharacterized protein n=1 Tax=Parasponia andersonii TaxID=3476 RepID=A0A2P5D0B9_PARAD|nr:hypothetical protein PanWU01x14_107440 [Parasponia andersonii]